MRAWFEPRATSHEPRFALHEAEGGGVDTVTMHVTVDDVVQVEWYAESGAGDGFFYPVGWWLPAP